MKPSVPVVGQIYFDLETFNALMYTGSAWNTIMPAVLDTRTDKEKVWDALSKPVAEYNNDPLYGWIHSVATK